MLSGCWLLADLDGTLLSTPHKAHGRYVSLTQSPCYAPLRRWLRHGGSVCVVTTADTRALAQVYVPLRAHLTSSSSMRRRTSAANATAHTSAATNGGVLLLCLYTGAVLYRCSADGVELVPAYTRRVHCATRESVELAAQYNVTPTWVRADVIDEVGDDNTRRGAPATTTTAERVCVRGTCVDARTSRTLLEHLVATYVTYMHDVLRGDAAVTHAQSRLSRRYRDMWRVLLSLLDTLYACATHDAAAPAHAADTATTATAFASATTATTTTTTTRSDEAVAWQLRYVREHRDLFVALGIIRVECVKARVSGNDLVAVGEASPAQPHTPPPRHDNNDDTKTTHMTAAAQHALSVLSAGLSPSLRRCAAAALRDASTHLTALLGAAATSSSPHSSSNDNDDNKHNDNKHNIISNDDDDDEVAQLIVLGVPLTLFSRYFATSMATFVRVGVQALPQPNSVVFCKLGVSKSTALRYLLGKDRVVRTHAPQQQEAAAPLTADDSLVASVRAGRCVALGDNPHSTDYELTVFADVPFVSCESATQRAERHRRIARRLARTRATEARGAQPTMPDGSRAPSYAELSARRQRSGVLMDDTLPAQLLYVGGEEDGTATFLHALMHYLRVPALRDDDDVCSSSSSYGNGGAPVTVTPCAFREAVYAAQHAARHVIARQATQPSKL